MQRVMNKDKRERRGKWTKYSKQEIMKEGKLTKRIYRKEEIWVRGSGWLERRWRLKVGKFSFNILKCEI